MTPQVSFTPRQIADLHQARRIGVGIKTIARLFGLSPPTVRRLLDAGPPPEMPSPGRRLVMTAKVVRPC